MFQHHEFSFMNDFMHSAIYFIILEITTNRWRSLVVSYEGAALYLMWSDRKGEVEGEFRAMQGLVSVFVTAYSLKEWAIVRYSRLNAS